MKTKIGFLTPSTFVSLIGLEDQFKNIQVINSTHSGTAIKGLHKDGDSYKPLYSNYVISNSTEVEIIDKQEAEFKIEEEKERKKLVAKLESLMNKTSNNNAENISEGHNIAPKRGRGRPPKSIVTDYSYPNGNFTCQEFADINSISKVSAYNYIINSPKIRCIGEKPSKRGRGTKIYKTDNSLI